MYADDTTIYFNFEDFSHIIKETDINNKLEKVNTWLKLNKLSLNTQKTKLMLFHSKQKRIHEVSVIINGTKIELVALFYFLDIMLDENLSWKSHIEMVGNKISKVVMNNSLIVSYGV